MTPQNLDPSSLQHAARAAARILAGEADAVGSALVAALEYGAGSAPEQRHRAALLRAAAGFERLFVLETPDAPGAIAMGGEIDPARLGFGDLPPVSVSGLGTTLRDAFESCIGEGIESLSLYTDPAVAFTRHAPAEAFATMPALRRLWDDLAPWRRAPATPMLDLVAAQGMADGDPVWLPADLCRLRPAAARALDVPWPISTGCAAASHPDMAAILGLLELIERDAAALWWCGGAPARPLDAGSVAAAESAALLAQLRAGMGARVVWLLDIASDLGVPVVAALSCRADGTGLCCGLAARPTLRAAARRAVLELCQMELGARIAAIKQADGQTALDAADQQHLRRTSEIVVATWPPLHPTAPPAPAADLPPLGPAGLRQMLCARLAAVGLTAYQLDLTQLALGVPVARVICPGLQPASAPPVTARLAAMAAKHGRSLDPWPAYPML